MARVVIPDVPHHVVQRGVRSMDVFRSDEDRQLYLRILVESAARWGVSFWAWCLMNNHLHFLAVPRELDSLARAFGRTNTRYATIVNRREGVRGHLFQERFWSCPVQTERYAVASGRYIERNPAKAGMVKNPLDWPWSSAVHNATGELDPLVKERHLDELAGPWTETLLEGLTDQIPDEVIELHVRSGRPLGDLEWVRRQEQRLGKTLLTESQRNTCWGNLSERASVEAISNLVTRDPKQLSVS
jgi:putative transposase